MPVAAPILVSAAASFIAGGAGAAATYGITNVAAILFWGGINAALGAAVGALGVGAGAAAEAAAGAFLAGTRFARVDLAARELGAVHPFERGAGFVIVAHFHEPETPGLARQLVLDDAGRAHVPEGGEGLTELFFGGLVRDVADVDIHLRFLL